LGATEKRPKISKKYRKIALFSLFQAGANGKKRPKNSKKRPKNSTFKPLSPCLKIKGDHGPSCPPLLMPMPQCMLAEYSIQLKLKITCII